MQASRLAFAAALFASACTPDGSFPSLEPRAIETEDALEEPARVPASVAPDSALRARTADLVARARAGEAEFDAAYARAAAAVRAAGAEGSESWIEAQQALSRAEAARAPVTSALAELDRLSLDRAGVPTAEADLAALRRAFEEAGRIAAGQQERLDRLRAAISR